VRPRDGSALGVLFDSREPVVGALLAQKRHRGLDHAPVVLSDPGGAGVDGAVERTVAVVHDVHDRHAGQGVVEHLAQLGVVAHEADLEGVAADAVGRRDGLDGQAELLVRGREAGQRRVHSAHRQQVLAVDGQLQPGPKDLAAVADRGDQGTQQLLAEHRTLGHVSHFLRVCRVLAVASCPARIC